MFKVVNFKIINGCNLSCKGCSHMSQFASASSKIDIDIMKKDILNFKKNFEVTHHVSLLGGEVLLEPRWSEVLTLLEELYLNHIQVRFYTNGLLLSKNKEKIVKHLQRGSVLRISIHESPDTKIGNQVYNEIKTFLEHASEYLDELPSLEEIYEEKNNSNDRWNIPKKIAGSRQYDDFWTELFKTKNNKLYPHHSNDIFESYQHCPCVNPQIYNGRLWKCPQTAYLRDTLKSFEQLDDPVWQPYLKYKGISLNPTKEEKEKFIKNQYRPVDFCSMCPKGGFYSKKSQDTGKKRHIEVVPL